MSRLLIGLMILAGVIAAIAVIQRRSGSRVDDWDSFAAGDSYAQASKATSKAADAAKDAATTATKAAKDAVAKTADAAKEAASTASMSAKDV